MVDWVETWVSTPQRASSDQLPPAPFTGDGQAFKDTTVRQTVRASIGGDRLRLCFSNAFGDRSLAIASAAVGLPLAGRAGGSALHPGSSAPVTFQGRAGVSVPVGEQVESDAREFPVPAGGNLTVTVHVAEGQAADGITSHPGSRTTSYLIGGDRVGDADLPGAVPIDHWYFLCGVRVPAGPDTASAVVIGDSLTDGRGSTTNANDRWPDRLTERLRSDPETAGIAVLNHGVGGGRLLEDGSGTGAVERQIRAALSRHRLRWIVLLKGVNDLGTAPDTPASLRRLEVELIGAYQRIITRAHERGVRVYGATIPPFGGNADYDDPAGHRERTRQRVNQWVRTSGTWDEVIDADTVLRDPTSPRQLLPAYDVGDHLHLNPRGYTALADAVPLSLFRS